MSINSIIDYFDRWDRWDRWDLFYIKYILILVTIDFIYPIYPIFLLFDNNMFYITTNDICIPFLRQFIKFSLFFIYAQIYPTSIPSIPFLETQAKKKNV